jgi:hypothetical protein
MGISVTPIPRLTSLTTPAFTLGTANAGGDAITAVASNSTLLAFDTTLPAATGTAAVGSSTVAPRRDHVHASTVAATQAEIETGSATDVFVSPGRQQFHQSAAKAWCLINADGTLKAGNYGISSVGDTATGSRTINFTTAFAAADQYVVAHCLNNALGYIQVSSYNTTAQAFLTKNSSGTNTDIISQHVYFGTQA